MSNSTIKLRRSSISGRYPDSSQLELGEVAINTHDGKMFFKRDASGNTSIIEVGRKDETAEVFYVTADGSDSEDGKSIGTAFGSLNHALNTVSTLPNATIFLKSGTHYLDNSAGGVDIPANVSVVGDNHRSTTLRGTDANNDLLYVRSNTYVSGLAFKGHANGAAAIAFNPDGSAGAITNSPYVQNCSSITTDGVGMRIDGAHASGLRSMVSHAFTQINLGGKGVHLLNRGYAQLVSIFTVSCDVGILAESGGQCSVSASNSSFGNYGLKATGSSAALYSGVVDQNATAGSTTIVVSGLTEKPKFGDAIQFAGTGDFFSVRGATDLSGDNNDTSTVTLEQGLPDALSATTTVDFFQRSFISAANHTFEYVGTGIDAVFNTPRNGGIPIQENEVVEDSNNLGSVYFTSTDHNGDFRIGSELVINRTSGTIEGQTFDRSLFAVLTPYILALES